MNYIIQLSHNTNVWFLKNSKETYNVLHQDNWGEEPSEAIDLTEEEASAAFQWIKEYLQGLNQDNWKVKVKSKDLFATYEFYESSISVSRLEI